MCAAGRVPLHPCNRASSGAVDEGFSFSGRPQENSFFTSIFYPLLATDLSRNMGKGGRTTPPRVLVLYGSESGGTKGKMKSLVKAWVAKANGAVTIDDVAEGNSVASTEALQEMAKTYDVILVASSSYGEGEPPETIMKFFKVLMAAANGGEKPLAGMQHAVLGFGASCYDTYQNAPRLLDRYLGEAGSRRMAQRAELDECDESGLDELKQPEYARWVEEVYSLLVNLPTAEKPPVCDWTKPNGQVLLIADSQGTSSVQGTMIMGAVIMGVVAVTCYSMMSGETA